jgi:hypothetical protein
VVCQQAVQAALTCRCCSDSLPLPPATCHLPPATCHLPPATCLLPPAQVSSPQVNPRLSLWVPPQSPFSLIEEQLCDDPWRLLVACMLLNKTTGEGAQQHSAAHRTAPRAGLDSDAQRSAAVTCGSSPAHAPALAAGSKGPG